MSPNMVYYLELYLVVWLIRFFKVRQEDAPFEWNKVFAIGLEIVYTASGFIILLLEKRPNYRGPLVIFYAILLLLGAGIDMMPQKFTWQCRLAIHSTILVVVVVATVVAFSQILEPSVSAAAPKANYRVVIPYWDRNLARHVTEERFGPRLLVAIEVVEASSPSDAKKLAIDQFWDDKNVQIFVTQKGGTDKRQVLRVEADRIAVEKW